MRNTQQVDDGFDAELNGSMTAILLLSTITSRDAANFAPSSTGGGGGGGALVWTPEDGDGAAGEAEDAGADALGLPELLGLLLSAALLLPPHAAANVRQIVTQMIMQIAFLPFFNIFTPLIHHNLLVVVEILHKQMIF